MKGMALLALAALGVMVAAGDTDANGTRHVNLRGVPRSVSTGRICPNSQWTFREVGANGVLGADPSFGVPPGQVFVLTDAEWTAEAIKSSEPQELDLDSGVFPPPQSQVPVLTAPASAVVGSHAYGQVHLATGIPISTAVCASVSSGQPLDIYLQGILQPGS